MPVSSDYVGNRIFTTRLISARVPTVMNKVVAFVDDAFVYASQQSPAGDVLLRASCYFSNSLLVVF